MWSVAANQWTSAEYNQRRCRYQNYRFEHLRWLSCAVFIEVTNSLFARRIKSLLLVPISNAVKMRSVCLRLAEPNSWDKESRQAADSSAFNFRVSFSSRPRSKRCCWDLFHPSAKPPKPPRPNRSSLASTVWIQKSAIKNIKNLIPFSSISCQLYKN